MMRYSDNMVLNPPIYYICCKGIEGKIGKLQIVLRRLQA